MARVIDLDPTSRMQKTKLMQTTDVYGNGINQYYWGTWKAYDFPESTGDKYHRLNAADIGRFDNLSYRYYDTVDFAWVIIWVNLIDDIFDTDNIGKRIRIPNKKTVLTQLGAL